jgi:D-3-phosphoglycerate dehydrogenase
LWKTLWKTPAIDATTRHEPERITALHHAWCACRHGPGAARRRIARHTQVWHYTRALRRRERARRVDISMHIVVADDLPPSAVQLLRDEGWSVDATAGRGPAELVLSMADADALIVRSATKVTPALIAAAPKLRAIARAGAGVDNIDLDAAGARGIVVMNAPGATSASVAELTIGLMVVLARHVAAADRTMKQARWEKKKFAGSELGGKTLGVVGFGRIGRIVARLGGAFDMTVVAHDPAVSAAADMSVSFLALDELCARADYITLHLPATTDTHHLFGAVRLARCRPGVRLVNTSRGELVDEAALLAALQSGHVAGAALDVFEKEPPMDWALAQHPSVVATPHVAASTSEAQERVGLATAAAVRDYLKDGRITNPVPSRAAASR